MHAVEVQSAGRPGTSVRSSIGKLLGEVGTTAFDETLAGLASRLLRCDQVTAFAFHESGRPRLLNICAKRNGKASEHASTPYMTSYWQGDPTNLFLRGQLDSDKDYIVFMSDSEVPDSDYRRDCYLAIGIRYRMSVIHQVNSEYIKISFHRPAEAGPFVLDTLHDLPDNIDLLCSLLLKHHDSAAPTRHGMPASDHFNRKLQTRCPELTSREREVCSLIAIGMSSEAIALTLRISINTVLTFRRRAYARLNISTQNELLRLVLY
ncbi:helix-turn-helix transcriptional regulator [Mesorhizobium sp. Cs1299R1N3]|uniref:helix-turn-helix transcriptional regulator n=1 Tax=Mesorhizobium sp. Cs1299R1N3 TaxID=3015173 RepID=UPI00301D5FF7